MKARNPKWTPTMPDAAERPELSQAEKEAVWAPVAHEVLIRTAETYGGFITYGELASHVQEATSISTRVGMQNWIGRLLGAVSDDAESREEPHLSSLCVHQDQSIGLGYPWAAPDSTEIEREEIAARDRLECYRVYAKDLPADGGSPLMTPAMSERFERQRRSTPAPRPICPRCSMELPASGICENH